MVFLQGSSQKISELVMLHLDRYVVISVADPHRKNADADPGKNLKTDADPDADADSCSY
jgi:hypothetical protein